MDRKPLTWAKLREITRMRLHDCMKTGVHPDTVQIIIPRMCWSDLRMDREIFGMFDFATTTKEPTEFRMNNIRCIIEQHRNELVAIGDEP